MARTSILAEERSFANAVLEVHVARSYEKMVQRADQGRTDQIWEGWTGSRGAQQILPLQNPVTWNLFTPYLIVLVQVEHPETRRLTSE